MDCGEGGGGEGWEAAVQAEVGAGWWDDPDGADLRARFKAFTGQRRDWPQPKLLFWKDLLLRVARRLRLCSAPAHLVTSVWFARLGGLTPLCLPQVLASFHDNLTLYWCYCSELATRISRHFRKRCCRWGDTAEIRSN